MADFERDFLVFGSGVAGLWLFKSLITKGYSVSLIEQDRLGGIQTAGSQGMIHGGQKYALSGNVPDVATRVAAMPALWQDCLAGTGQLDLGMVDVLATEQMMWPDASLLSGAASFAAAKSVNGRTEKRTGDALPEVLVRHGIKTGYVLHETVMDVKSLIGALSEGGRDEIYKARLNRLERDENGDITHAVLADDDGTTATVKARHYIFACGKGNEDILSMLGQNPEGITQRRPLRQVMARNLPYPLFGHCVSASPKPRVTVTSYRQGGNDYIWYLGGALAEAGANMDEQEHIRFADKEMRALFPKLDWDEVKWAVWDVDRAEAFDEKGRLPAGPCIRPFGNALLVWPTKMTFAPALSLFLEDWLATEAVRPAKKAAALPFAAPESVRYPWETVREWKDAV